jgi:hypothetical protein
VPTSIVSIVVLAVGCMVAACGSEPSEEAPETSAETVAIGPALSLMDIEGTWKMRYVPVSGDTVVTTSQVQVTADGWTLLLPGREPIEAVVAMSGGREPW